MHSRNNAISVPKLDENTSHLHADKRVNTRTARPLANITNNIPSENEEPQLKKSKKQVVTLIPSIVHSSSPPFPQPVVSTLDDAAKLYGQTGNINVFFSNGFGSEEGEKKRAKRPLPTDVSVTVEAGEVQISKKRKRSDPMLIENDVEMYKDDEKIEEMNIEEMDEEHEDIDENDRDDPQSVVPYVDEIYAHMNEKEKADKLSSNFMSKQTDVNEKMRSILVDWLVEVHRMFKLLPETLFLTVNLIDKFIENRQISRDKLQLVGITAMLIASKYEEIYAPECNDFVYISDGAYTKEEILVMEKSILNALNFNLTTPCSLHFLRRYSKAAGSDYTAHTLCKYIIEMALIDSKLLKYLPSQIAAASVYIARRMMDKAPFWTPTLKHYTKYSEETVQIVARDLNEMLKKILKSTQFEAVKKKYSTIKYQKVALIPFVDF